MLKSKLTDDLKVAMKSQDKCRTATLRLILASVKDREIAARGKGGDDALSDEEILETLAKMIKQRDESIRLYEEGGRLELAEREREESEIIKEYLPRQLSDEEIRDVVLATVADQNGESLKDMGRIMAALKKDHAGEMNFGVAGAIVKEALSA